MAAEPAREHQVFVAAAAGPVREAVRQVVEAWSGVWDESSGALALPLAAGLRRGRFAGRLEVTEVAGGSRLSLREESRSYRLHGSALAVLLIAAAGGLTALLWPFFPRLLPLASIGAVLALAAWFLVISRLATNGPEDFLDMVVESASAPDRGSSTEF